MSITNEEIVNTLRQVIDPELRQNLVDLGMIRAVNVAHGCVTVTLALTTSGCPLKEQLAADVRRTVLDLPGVVHVQVELTEMTAAELRPAGGCILRPTDQPHRSRGGGDEWQEQRGQIAGDGAAGGRPGSPGQTSWHSGRRRHRLQHSPPLRSAG